VQHLRACHSKSPLDTKAVIILQDWPKFKALTKKLKLINRLPKGENVFMRTTPTCTYESPDIITSAWVINFLLIDANTHVLSPLTSTSVNTLKPNIVTAQLEANEAIKAANKYVSTTTIMVVMGPYEAKALMRFNATSVLNGLSAKAYTLIDTTTSLNFVSKEFVVANSFYKDCKTAPKLVIRVASEQRISTTKMFCPSVFTIDGHEFTDLQFRVLSHFKSSDIILGLPALKQLNVLIHCYCYSNTVCNSRSYGVKTCKP